MKLKLLFTTFFICATIIANAQTDYLTINKNIRLPKDSIEQTDLINDLNEFLFSIKEDKDIETWILSEEKTETQILIGEIQDFANNDTINYKPHLINLETFSDNISHSIQIAYMSSENSQPLHAIFEFIAHKKDDKFLFSSPLVRNTKEWNVKTHDYLVFHYQNKNHEIAVDEYAKYIKKYDEKLGVTRKTDYYFCDDCENLTQMMRLVGMPYKLDYNGFAWNSFYFDLEDKSINIFSKRLSQQKTIDPHDLFHVSASYAIPAELRNHFMVCGCAYVYGGSWRISWTDIQKIFKARMTYDKKTDWLALYFERYNFGESQERHLLVTQFVNALIIEKVEKEQGFSAVMKLLSSGNIFKEREKFFKILEEVTGINEKNFNKKVGKLIDEAMKDL
jgi:hypothetical protein